MAYIYINIKLDYGSFLPRLNNFKPVILDNKAH